MPENTAEAPLPKASLPNLQSAVLLVLRIAIGWHFFYEGIAKLLIPGWSAGPYLQLSRGVFSGFFHWLASGPTLLRVVDLLNIWGLILIGLALILGSLTRLAAGFAVFLLALYYLAHPPLVQTDFRIPLEGHYLFVDKNLVELLALCVFLAIPSEALPGLDRLLRGRRRTRAAGTQEPPAEERPAPADPLLTRREVFGGLASVPILGFLGYGAYKKYTFEKIHAITGATIQLPDTSLKDLKGQLQAGAIGKLKMSRLILGNNLIGGWAHARDLIYAPSLFKAYNTERKVLETIELAERSGITMMMLVNKQYPVFHKYRKLVSEKMQTMCQVYPTDKDLKTDINQAVDNGATTMYVQGAYAERFVRNGQIDLLGKALDHMKSQGYVAGIGAHSIEVPILCERAGLQPDYYVKTLHPDNYWSAHPREYRVEFSVDQQRYVDHNKFHDNMFDLFPEKTIEFMAQVRKPWVAFKVLAAGAIPPRDGFKFAFENGADFICVGMFDFQIVEDVNIVLDVLPALQNRQRPWCA